MNRRTFIKTVTSFLAALPFRKYFGVGPTVQGIPISISSRNYRVFVNGVEIHPDDVEGTQADLDPKPRVIYDSPRQ